MLRSRQGNAGVVVNSGDGGPSFIAAVGTSSSSRLAFSNCKDKRCKTCPTFIKSETFKSNITNQQFKVINHTEEHLTCHSQNIIYLLTCLCCNIQYVGETVYPFHKRNNQHRTEMNEHFQFHRDSSCNNYSFSYQIIEKLPGTGYKANGTIDEVMMKIRKDKEDVWIKKMRTIFPYGLCEKARGKDNDCSIRHEAVGKSYKGFPIPRTGIRPVRSRTNRNLKTSIISCNDFFSTLENLFLNNLQNSFNQIRIILDKTKKKVLKEIAYHILQRSTYTFHPQREQWYLYILDIIDTKLFKEEPIAEKKKAPENICTMKFVNKGIEHINISEILRLPETIQSLPETLQDEEKLPKVVMKLDSPIRSQIMNYEQTVRSIHHMNDDEVSFTINSETNSPFPCSCSESPYCDPHHKHIVTGDLRIVENQKLRKLLTKGPNYREKKTLNFNKCLKEIENSINTCASKLSDKYKLPLTSFDNWITLIKQKTRDKIRQLKSRIVPQQTKPVLDDEDVKRYLAELHGKYVIVPIDKAANNIAIICKQFYIMRLLKEIGTLDNHDLTYQLSNENKIDIIHNNQMLCDRYGLSLSDSQKTLPIMYWTPKMHYVPSRARFIVSSAKCSTKPLSRIVSNTFKRIFKQIQNFHNKSKFYKNYNRFWVIENSKPLIDKLNKINTKKKAREISTFDFSTLYTKLPHNDLLHVLNSLIDFVFDGGTRNYLGFNEHSTFWMKKRSGKKYFSKQRLKAVVKHLITSTYFEVGNLLIRQSIGIPMGIDPAPFWANLYLYFYEDKFIVHLISVDKMRARKFLNAMRFIDDECNLNDNKEFSKSFVEIYPPELQLKCEHEGNHATFLDLDISIFDNTFIYKLFDKRDDFPFTIVRMPDLNGNIPSNMFYGSIMSEFLRIARCTLLLSDFIPRARKLYERMINQGGSANRVLRQINKGMSRYPLPFQKYNTSFSNIITQITS